MRFSGIFLGLLVALVLAFAIAAMPTEATHARASIPADSCSAHYPPGAQQPIQCYWSTVTEKIGSGTSVACINLTSNPFGYYSVYKYWYGWSYIDARGISYVGWYGPVFKVGPWYVVGSYTWIQCGTGG